MYKNIQPLILKPGDSINGQPMIMAQMTNWSLSKMWQRVCGFWSMQRHSFHLTTGTPSWLKHGIPSIYHLETASGKTLQKKAPPSPSVLLNHKNTQACAASIHVFYGSKAEEINNISCHTVVPIKLQVTRTDGLMVVLWAKGAQKSSRNIILRASAYDAVRKIKVTPVQDMNK